MKSENKKQYYIKCWKCPLHSAMRAFNLFLTLDATRWRVSAVTFEMHSLLFCFSSSNVCGLFLSTFFFKNPQRYKSGGDRWVAWLFDHPVLSSHQHLSFPLSRFPMTFLCQLFFDTFVCPMWWSCLSYPSWPTLIILAEIQSTMLVLQVI
jgi:hypothetical protein